MLALPALTGAPRSVRAATSDPVAARLALAIAGEGPIRAPRGRSHTVELHVLQEKLKAWLGAELARFSLFKPGVHITVGATPYHAEMREDQPLQKALGPGGYTVFLGTDQSYILGPIFYLEKRWRDLEASAPGLAASALDALDHAARHSLPLFLPHHGEYFASFHWWMGEEDEAEVLANYREEAGENAPPPDDIRTRAAFDAALPPAVCRPKRLSAEKLERLARRRDVGTLARLTLELRAATAKACRAGGKDPEFHSADDNGMQAIGYAATVRWNSADPMPELFDHYANDAANSEGYEESFGWYVSRDPAALPWILRSIERRLELARLVEPLLPLIGTRGRP